MIQMPPENRKELLEDLIFRIKMAASAIILVISIIYLGDLLAIDFLNSIGGILLTTVLTAPILIYLLIRYNLI